MSDLSVVVAGASAVPTGQWLEDEAADNCMQCQHEFSFFNRKHHCRKCGGLFCSSCASNWLALPQHMIILPPYALADASYELTGLARCCGACANIAPLGASATSAVATSSGAPTLDPNPTTNNFTSRAPQSYQRRPVNGSNSGELVTNAQVTIPTPTASVPDMPSYREVNAEEYRQGQRFRRYLVNVPHDMRRGGRFSVSLDDRIMSVTLPLFIDPGERIYVKAPLCAEVEATEVGLDAATSTLDSANSAVGEGGSACGNCTYINPSFFPICQMCGDALAVVSNPHTGAGYKCARALELLPADVVKRYYVSIPPHIAEGGCFQVSLDGRVYTVVCPSGAVAGEKIIVSGPDPRHTPLRIQPGSAAVGGCALATTMSSSSELYDEVVHVDLEDVAPEVVEAVKMVILTTARDDVEAALRALVAAGSLPSLEQALDVRQRLVGGDGTSSGAVACRHCTFHNRKLDTQCAMCGYTLVRQRPTHAPSAVHEMEAGFLPTATLVEQASTADSSLPITTSVEVAYDSSMIIAIADPGVQCGACGADCSSSTVCSCCGALTSSSATDAGARSRTGYDYNTPYSSNANFTTATVIQAYRR